PYAPCQRDMEEIAADLFSRPPRRLVCAPVRPPLDFLADRTANGDLTMFSFLRQRKQSHAGPTRGARHSRAVPRSRPCLEHLEDRSLLSAASPVPPGGPGDIVLIGDGTDDSVKSFDAATGQFLGNTVAPGDGGLHGPRGIIFRSPGQLLLVDQN